MTEPPFGVTPGVAVAEERELFTLPWTLSVETSPAARLDARMKLCLTRVQLEAQEKLRREEREFQLRRELEMEKLEADTAVRMRQLELQKGEAAEYSVSSAASGSQPSSHADVEVAFNVTRHISLVPVFREAEVESYFSVFEHFALALRWTKDAWAILLECRLTGKAQEACSSLSIEDCLVYETVKTAIVRVYELVPEAYSQRFRSLKKNAGQTYCGDARELKN